MKPSNFWHKGASVNGLMKTEDAVAAKIAGWNVYGEDIIYKARRYCVASVNHLNAEALNFLKDTMTLSSKDEIRKEDVDIRRHSAALVANEDVPWPNTPVIDKLMGLCNLEAFKIAGAFELHLKARFLEKGFVIHEIKKDSLGFEALAKEQKKRPIAISEVFSIDSYYFDGKINFLPMLGNSTVPFSTLTERPAYRLASGLTEDVMDIISEYRNLRNAVHFPPRSYIKQTHLRDGRWIDEFLVRFANNEIIKSINCLNLELDRHWTLNDWDINVSPVWAGGFSSAEINGDSLF